MKRKSDEKKKKMFRSKLDPILPDLKMTRVTRLPAKFVMKTHQKKFLGRVESGLKKERDEDESKVNPMIPQDLEVAILTRLPGKSLMRFQCVSKMWSSMIRSQRFIDSFLSMQSSRLIIVLSNGAFAKGEAKRLFIFSSEYSSCKSSSLVANLDLVIPSVAMSYGSKCSSVHGFVGCSNSGKYIVCNPSTGKVTTLPCLGARTSLGYDPVHNQLKALSLISFPHGNHDLLVHEVVTLGGGGEWRRNKFTSPPYLPLTKGVSINGFVYYGAWAPTRDKDPVIVCFDVRYEKLSFIKAPRDVVFWEGESILIEYNGKLASIVRHPYGPFCSFDLWILEGDDDWSKQTFKLPFSLGVGMDMYSPGTNQAGEIIFAPKFLSENAQDPFHIFYYNVVRKDMTRVRIHGIADDEEFRRRYALVDKCYVSISPQHLDNIASLL